jgi:Arc/MetJ family transcription regulator
MADDRMTVFRRKRRESGFAEANIWLSPEDQAALNAAMEHLQFRTKSEAVSFALREAFKEIELRT